MSTTSETLALMKAALAKSDDIQKTVNQATGLVAFDLQAGPRRTCTRSIPRSATACPALAGALALRPTGAWFRPSSARASMPWAGWRKASARPACP